MIELAELSYSTSDSQRVWDLSSLFTPLTATVTLYESIAGHSLAAKKGNRGAPSRFVSRSYSGDFMAQIESLEHCGIDIELGQSSQDNWSITSRHFIAAVLAPHERESLLATSWANEPFFETQIWCSKEALAKASGDASKYEPNELVSPMTWPNGLQDGARAKSMAFVTLSGSALIMWAVTSSC